MKREVAVGLTSRRVIFAEYVRKTGEAIFNGAKPVVAGQRLSPTCCLADADAKAKTRVFQRRLSKRTARC